MLKNQNIICISSIDWSFIWQQHQAIMSRLAKNNNKILFIENTGVRAPNFKDMPRIKSRIMNRLRSTKGFRQEMENLYIYSPLILPFPYSRIARFINKVFIINAIKKWTKITNFYDPIIWTFLPTPLVLDIANTLPHKLFIYYCTDNFAATSKGARNIVKYEGKVLKIADLVFVMAHNMVEYCKTYNSNVTCIPMGVDSEIFIKNESDYKKPKELLEIKNKIIGYVGGIRESIDKELLKNLLRQFSDYTFVFVGPIQTDVSFLKDFKNALLVGKKDHKELPNYIKYFDACIIPYKKDSYTDNISPAKLNEYLIMGKPIVSTNLYEVELFNKDNGNILDIAETGKDFSELLSKVLKCPPSIDIMNQRKEIALKNSWDRKIEKMSEIIENKIEIKKDINSNWREGLLHFYNKLKVKFAKVIFVFLFLWGIIFYTPLMWFVAEPLKISQAPEKADAIVVFAGGVGESGKAGQGYEERVEYAVELYKKGYASNIIFSSGFVYLFKEPELMKVLAVSLGVPESAIFLEDKASNTYENVKFTNEILSSKNFNKIILISSPYHMRRAYLVFHKANKKLSVIYSPIPKSLFYSQNPAHTKLKSFKKITFTQIRAIIHEYLGIAYYWFKGWA